MNDVVIRPNITFLLTSFVAYIAAMGIFLFYVFSWLAADELESKTLILLVLITLVQLMTIMYLVALGLYVRQQGKSVMLWVFLTMIGGPLGVLVSFFNAIGKGDQVATILFWCVAGPFLIALMMSLLYR